MNKSNLSNFTRRDFLSNTTALGAASLLGWPDISHAEPPLETTTIRLPTVPAICIAPQYIATALLRAEGFKEINYVGLENVGPSRRTASGAADMTMDAVGAFLTHVDGGAPLVALAGVHLGCYELFGSDRVQRIRDLKGKRVSIDGYGGPQHVFLSSMIAYVGLDPRKDIKWVDVDTAQSMRLFVEDKVDAFLGFPPEPQELRAKKIGHVIVNTIYDKPWSQYFCCYIIARSDYVKKFPVATKRAVRALLKATDICVQEPERVAKMVVDGGFTPNYDYALEALKEVPYNAWRTFDPEDALRFHALRLHESGLIKTSPNKLIARTSDWRFLNELKKELKA
jgi:NitT/TauT family transport system substrate-binding protein